MADRSNAWIKDQLESLGLPHADIPYGVDDQGGIQLALTGPQVVGGPEVPTTPIADVQNQLPGYTLLPAAPAPQEAPGLGELLSTGKLNLARDLAPAYVEHGPKELWRSLKDFKTAIDTDQPIAPTLNRIMESGGLTLAPLALPAMAAGVAANPLLAGAGLAGSMALGGGAEHVATKLGASPELAKLAGNLAGNIPTEGAMAAAAPFVPTAVRALRSTLDQEAAVRIGSLLKNNPELAPITKWMHPSEIVALSRMTPEAQGEFARVHAALPPTNYLGALARAGNEKLGWYEHSRAAIEHVFGQDAGLFAGIVASLSPQNSVEMNLRNAVHVYRGWVQAGRPTDRAAIERIMAANVLGEKGEKSVLQAWKNNTVAVLQGGNAISGPKVDSFWRNLRDRMIETPYGPWRQEDAVTLDAWMSNVLGIQQTYFSGKGPSGKTAAAIKAKAAMFARMDPGYGPGYLASAAKIREAATAAGLTPEQMQETIWSWAKALYEQSEKTGVSAVDIVKSGTLDHSALKGTPDFSTLFHDPKYAEPIQGAGLGGQLASLQPAAFPEALTPSPIDRKWQLQAADVLDKLRASRKVSSDLRVGINAPETVAGTLNKEGMPGGQTGVAPELLGMSQGKRNTYAHGVLRPNTDVRGESVLLKAAGIPTAETTAGIGVWSPPEGGKTQFNTMDAEGYRARLVPTEKGLWLHPEDRETLLFVSRLGALMDAQFAHGSTGLRFDLPDKNALHVLTLHNVRGDTFKDLLKQFPENKWAIVNKGGDTPGYVLDLIRHDGGAVTEADAAKLKKYLQRKLPATFNKKGERLPAKADITLASKAEGMYEELPWGKPGEKPVTTFTFQNYDALPASVKAGLDSQKVKEMAAWKLRFLQGQAIKNGGKLTIPEPYLNAVRAVAEGGVSALRRALHDSEQFLPVLLLLGLVPPLADQTQSTPGPS